MTGLVYVGKIISIEQIEGADFIVAATVVCGEGGKWRGIVQKDQFEVNDKCLVYLPDAIIPPNNDMKFMEKHKWRVKMCRFKGVPSEVLIMPYSGSENIGFDITSWTGVTKYFKPVPAHLQGLAKGHFPSFIPKTDEPNYQRHPEEVQKLIGQQYYVSEKADGSSTTVYKWKGEFGVCSRNLELVEDEKNGYWMMANKYNLRDKLPEGIAIQFETCGPGIQSNPMGLTEISAFAFGAYNIAERRHLNIDEFYGLCGDLRMSSCRIIETFGITGCDFSEAVIENYKGHTYPNGKRS